MTCLSRHIALSALSLSLFGSVSAQRAAVSSLRATSRAFPLTPERPIDPGRPDTTIVPVDVREEYMPDPSATAGAPAPVGTLAHEIVRGNGGRVGVRVPLESFSGVHESSHGMSLVYHGGLRFSSLGRGWSLDGASVISRRGRDFFTDGVTSPVSLDGDEAWSLDGTRLLLQGVEGGVRRYRTQVGNTLALQDSAGRFTVLHPDGGKSYYGEVDSLHHYVTRHVGLDGTEVTYTYINSHRGYRLLTSVGYGEGRALSLHYSPAGDTASRDGTRYVAGVPISPGHRLDSLRLTKDGRVLASYTLTYPSGARPDAQPRMIVRLDSAGRGRLRPLRIAYHGSPSGGLVKKTRRLARMLDVAGGDMGGLLVGRGRFDPSSEDEGLFILPNRLGYNRFITGDYSSHYGSMYTPGDSILVTADLHHAGPDIPCSVIPAGDGLVDVLAMDADGLPGDELVRVNNRLSGVSDRVSVSVFANAGGAMEHVYTRDYDRPALSVNGQHTVRPKTFLAGDFDGDGRPDLLIVGHSDPFPLKASGYLQLIDMQSGSVKLSAALDSCAASGFIWEDQLTDAQKWAWLNQADRVFALDHDGDGKKELGVLNDHGLFIHSFAPDADGALFMHRIKADCGVTRADFDDLKAFVCDVNGDGNTDIVGVRVREPGGSPSIGRITLLSHGDGRFGLTAEGGGYSAGQVVLTDSDRDGCADIIRLDGGRLQDLGLPSNCLAVGGNVFDGSTASLAALLPDGTLHLYSHSTPADMACALASIDDGSGLERVFTHGRFFLCHDNAFAAQAYGFPYVPVAEGMAVNTRERLLAGDTVVSDRRYTYTAPTLHRQGLGFLGFGGVQWTDSITGRAGVREYSPAHLGALVYRGDHLSASVMTLGKTVDADRHISVFTEREVHDDFATGVSCATDYTRDGYGNVLTAVTAYPGGLTRSVSRQWHNVDSAGFWLVGLERGVAECVTRGGESTTAGRTTRYTADWLPDTVVTWRGGGQNAVATRVFQYDSQRRPVRVRARAYQGDALTRHIGYSGTSRQPLYVSDELGLRTTVARGPFGVAQASVSPELTVWNGDSEQPVVPIVGPLNPLAGGDGPNAGGPSVPTVDPGGPTKGDPLHTPLVTAVHRDAFGRVDSVTAPDGSVRAVALSWAGDVPGAVTMAETAADGLPAVRAWADALGRTVRRAVRRFDGEWAYTSYEYDACGRLSRESLPALAVSTDQWIEYAYDDFDRPVSRTWPDGHADTWFYDGLSVTSTVDGVTSTRTVDALGCLVGVEDGGGTLAYDLRPDGQPASVSAPGGVRTTFEYDAYGRRTAINDPSAGRRETAYDASGNVSLETDARGMAVASVHDSAGRLACRTFGDSLTVTLARDAWGRPVSMTGSDGHGKSWSWDERGRLAAETADGFTMAYTYDRSRPVSVACSKDNSYICTEHYTRMNGHLTSVTLSTGDTVWSLLGQDARLRPVRAGLGRLVQELERDPRGNVTARVTAAPGGGKIQWEEYAYSAATGDMTARADRLLMTGEDFGYDGLGRLTDVNLHAPAPGHSAQTVAYDGKGNILAHSDAGRLTYGAERPYAFSALLSPSPLVAARGQRVAYNAIQQPDTIAESGHTAVFGYYGDMSRASMAVEDSLGGVETRTYHGPRYTEFTRTSGGSAHTRRVLWLGGTPHDAPGALVSDDGGSWRLVHVLRDNLGSVTHVADTAGTVLQRLSYTAWGLPRNPATLEPCGPDAQPELLLGRGFTGHEHLPWFGLVNMNARLYDPAVGRFLGPDPLVQAPDNTQSYNRYSYCLNNPLRYVDLTGMSIIEHFNELTSTGENIRIHYTPDIEIEVVADAPRSKGDAWGDGATRFNVNWTPIWTSWSSSPYVDENDGGSFGGGGSNGLPGDKYIHPYFDAPSPAVRSISPDWSRAMTIASANLSYSSFLLKNSDYVSYAWVKYNIPQLTLSRVDRKQIHGAKAHSLSDVAVRLDKTAKMIGIASASYEGYLCMDSFEQSDIENGMIYGIDAIVDGTTTFMGPKGLAFDVLWHVCLKDVFWRWVYFNHEYIIMPEYHGGTLGRIDTLPFK